MTREGCAGGLLLLALGALAAGFVMAGVRASRPTRNERCLGGHTEPVMMARDWVCDSAILVDTLTGKDRQGTVRYRLEDR